MLWKGVIKMSSFLKKDTDFGVNEKLQCGKNFKNLEKVYTQLHKCLLSPWIVQKELKAKARLLILSVVYKSQNLKLKTHLKEKTMALYQKTNE